MTENRGNSGKKINNISPLNYEAIEKFSSISGLYERVFGKLLNFLVFNQKHENIKNILKNVYGYNKIDILFPKRIERDEFKYLTKIMFKELKQQENETGK